MSEKVVPFPAPGLKPPSDEELAKRFVERQVHEWRCVTDWGDRWMLFDGVVWGRDDRRRIEYEARMMCVDVAAPLKAKDAMKVLSGRTYSTVVKMAKCDPALMLGPDEWDRDGMAINGYGDFLEV